MSADDKVISITPLILFLRLGLVIESKPEINVDSYFQYELTPYPNSLFNSGDLQKINH